MPEYNFFIWTNVSEQITKVELAACPDDAGAVDWAEGALRDNAPYLVVEIWSGARFVGRRAR